MDHHATSLLPCSSENFPIHETQTVHSLDRAAASLSNMLVFGTGVILVSKHLAEVDHSPKHWLWSCKAPREKIKD